MNQITNGKPLRFFGLMMIGWLAIRWVSVNDMILPIEEQDLGALEKTRPVLAGRKLADRALAVSEALVTPGAFAAEPAPSDPAPPKPYRRNTRSFQKGIATSAAPIRQKSETEETDPAQEKEATHRGFTDSEDLGPINPEAASPRSPIGAMAPLSQKRGDRWRGSVWTLWRDGGATHADAVTGGRLGGSQAGMRVDFDLTPDAQGRTATYGRLSIAMNRPVSPEGAVGIAWQPARSVPVSLAAERRIALGNGGRNANAVLAVGGFGPRPVIASLQAEGYAQTGMVGFRSNDLFVDGKLSILSPVSKAPVRVGASVSGGAQPSVKRLDIGPEVQLRLPLPRATARLSIEWRERIAGLAAPTSGLAVTLGGDF